MKNILFGLIPALMWGIQPIIMTKLSGKSEEKVVGMGLGIFLVALFISIFKRPNNLSSTLILISFVDGLALSYGLINQIRGFSLVGISKGTPISTGTQLIGATLVGVLYFKEWSSTFQHILGIIAIILIIIGVSMTTFEEKKEENIKKSNLKKGIITLILSSVGFVLYTIILKVANINIWDALIPQGLGVLVGSYLLSKRNYKEKLFTKNSIKHIITGAIFAIANITLMISNEINGLSVGFTLTQMNVVIATIGGLVILKEKKTKKELIYVLLGLLLVVIGGVFIGITKS